MVLYHNTVSRLSKKRKYGMGGKPADTTIGVVKKKLVSVKGGKTKLKVFASDYVNAVVDGKCLRCQILDVKDNPANKDYIRRDIITKGAVVSVKSLDGRDLDVRVTSVPGRDGVLNGVVV